MLPNQSVNLAPAIVSVDMVSGQEVPGHVPLDFHPITGAVDQETVHQLGESIQASMETGQINPAAVRAAAKKMIKPSEQSQGVIMIPGADNGANAWAQNRVSLSIRFVVQTQTSQYYFIAECYTPYADFSMNGSMNPETPIILNSIIRAGVARHEVGPNGNQSVINVVENNQVLHEASYIGLDGQQHMAGTTARPSDLVVGYQETFSSNPSAYSIDQRTDMAFSPNRAIGFSSRRTNNIASSVMSNIITSMVAAQAASPGSYGSTRQDENYLLGHASAVLREPSITSYTVIDLIARNSATLKTLGYFTWSELEKAIATQGAAAGINYNNIKIERLRGAAQMNESESYSVNTEEKKVAVKLTHIVPSFCGANKVLAIGFNANNMTGPCVVTPTMGGTTMFNTYDGADTAAINKLMAVLSMGGIDEAVVDGMIYDIDVMFVRGGHMQMSITLNGAPYATPFSLPCYCDSLASMNMVADKNALMEVGATIGETVSSVMPTANIMM